MRERHALASRVDHEDLSRPSRSAYLRRVDELAAPAKRALPLASSPEVTMAASKSTKKNAKPLSKSAVLQAIADALVEEELSRKHVKLVVETLASIGHRELKKNGVFVLPGFAKFVVVKKPARPARMGINPFTKEKQKFAAKPASKGVRARPVKALKDAVA
jgi:nucleoid DNA-binding protein